jgi:hypothetical protein
MLRFNVVVERELVGVGAQAYGAGFEEEVERPESNPAAFVDAPTCSLGT